MLRRCLATPNPSFGMIPEPRTTARAQGNPSLASAGNDYGTMLAIRRVTFFEDGRSIVETWGTWRFRVMERGMMDGYLIGRVEMVEDWEGESEGPVPVSGGAGGSGSGSVAFAMGLMTEESESGSSGTPEMSAAGTGTASTAVNLTREGEGPSGGLRRRATSISTTEPEPSTSASEGSSSSSTRITTNTAPAPVERTNAELIQICYDFLEQLREVPWITQRINDAVIPPPADPALFSFWMALVRPSHSNHS